jgi:hypothetical protein
MKVIEENGEIEQWYIYLRDGDGNVIGHIAKDSDGGILSITIREFRPDGQEKLTYNYSKNYALRSRLVHVYDADGNWQHADQFNIKGEMVGKVPIRSSGYTKKPKSEE